MNFNLMNFRAAAKQVFNRIKRVAPALPLVFTLGLTACGTTGQSNWDYINPNFQNDPALCMEIIPGSGGTAFFTYDTPYAHLYGNVYNALGAANHTPQINYGYSYGYGYYGYSSPTYTSFDGEGTIGGIAVKINGGPYGSTVTDWNKQVFVPTTVSQMQLEVANPMWHSMDVMASNGGTGFSPTGTCQARHAQLQQTAPWALGPRS